MSLKARETSSPTRGRVVRSRLRDRDFALRRALLLADWVGLWLALLAAQAISGASRPLPETLWLLPTLPVWAVLFRANGLYRRPIRRFEPTPLDDMSALFHSLVIGSLGLSLFYEVVPAAPLDLDEVVLFVLLSLGLIAGLRVLLRLGNLRIQGPEAVLAIGPLADLERMRRKLGRHPEYEMELVGAIDTEGAAPAPGLPLSVGLDEVDELIASKRVEHLVAQLDFPGLTGGRLDELMRTCFRAGVRFSAFPRDTNLMLLGAEVNNIEGMGFLSYDPPVLSRSAVALKRSFDLGLSAILVVLLAPLMALIALAIKIDSRGPVLFRQVRVGKDGARFRLMKFRTMIAGADEMVDGLMSESSDPDWLVLARDPRVTRVGRFLRSNSLDELPQFWHVLSGKMSLVGPRPLSERDDREVRGRGRHRLDLTPGITGHWQVLGRKNIPFQEMVEIDYAYVARWSLLNDFKLLLQTVPAVLRRRGAS